MTTNYSLIEVATQNEFDVRGMETMRAWMNDAIVERGHCIVALAGGSTPKQIYTLLGEQDIDWSKVSFCLADERYVSADDKDSNQRLVRETLFAKGRTSAVFLFPDTTLPMHECTDDYESQLTHLLQGGVFDIVILGMGDDGHTTSLFPPVTDEGLMRVGVVHTTTDRFAVRDRISIALPLLQTAQKRLLLLTGEEKKKTWEKMIAADTDPKRWPLQPLLDTKTTVLARW